MTAKQDTPSAAAGGAAEAAFRSLVRTMGLLKRVMEPFFSRFGISGAHWSVLRTLHRAEEEGQSELRLTDLGDRLIVRPASVTGVIDRLQRMGLVARTVSPTDQRAKHVTLTPPGRELVRRVLEHHPHQMRSVLSGLSAEEQRELRRLLERLEPHLALLAERHEAPAPAGSNGAAERSTDAGRKKGPAHSHKAAPRRAGEITNLVDR